MLRACFKQTGKACDVVARFFQDFAAARSEGRHAASVCGTWQGRKGTALQEALRGARWVVFHASPVQRPEHITSLEVLAVRTIPLRVATTPGGIGSRVLFLSDSAVALGALRKGRSSSHAMNLRCRQVAAHVLAADLFLLGL